MQSMLLRFVPDDGCILAPVSGAHPGSNVGRRREKKMQKEVVAMRFADTLLEIEKE
jgi:hypothetical protein